MDRTTQDYKKGIRYSRQIGTYGNETMKKLSELKVFIIGLKGLGIEVAKNIILSGPKIVSLYDKDIVALEHLGTNFYITEEDIGKKTLTEASLKKLKNLNPFTTVDIVEDIYESIPNYNVVVLTDFFPKNNIIKIDEICAKHNIKFLFGMNMGLFGFIFSNFGKNHTIIDKDGKEPKRFVVTNITNEEKCLITIGENKKFDLENESEVLLKNIKGMEELNNRVYFVTKKDNNSFYINENSSNYQKYINSGDIIEIKKKYSMNYLSFNESILLPLDSIKNFSNQEETKMRQHKLYLCIINTLLEYYENDKKKPINEEFLLSKIKKLFNDMIETEKKNNIFYEDYDEDELQSFDELMISNMIRYSYYHIIPICSLIGGYLAQEIIKVTGQFLPINQWLFFDLYDHNHHYNKEKISDDSRYFYQESIFGKEMQKKLEKLNIFIVGAGAVGCELLKNLSMMGISSGGGKITITDGDSIELSNLNRQFLFSEEDVTLPKSKIACKNIRKMNPNVNVFDLQLIVNDKTLGVFNKEFWDFQDFVFSAVDSIDARKYIDKKCYKYNKIFLNCGTLGVRANDNVFIPHKTKMFNQIYIGKNIVTFEPCTLKSFPYKIEHCIEWGKAIFSDFFISRVRQLKLFLEDPQNFINNMMSDANNVFIEKYINIKQFMIILNDKNRISKLIEFGLFNFNILFNEKIKDLLKSYPLDKKYKDGTLFWSKEKRIPKVIDFLFEDIMSKQFINNFVSIYSECLGIEQTNIDDYIKKEISYFEFDFNNVTIEDKNNIIEELNSYKKDFNVNECEFDKDNKTHIDFLEASSNLRARNYTISEVDKNKILMLGGKVMAAVPTSTASVVGHLCYNLILLLYTRDIENIIKDGHFYLDNGEYLLLSPEEIEEEEEEPVKEYIEIKGSKTLKEFLEYIKEEKNIEINHCELNGKIIYDKIRYPVERLKKKQNEKLEKKIEDIFYTQIHNEEENECKDLIISITGYRDDEKIENFPLIKYII